MCKRESWINTWAHTKRDLQQIHSRYKQKRYNSFIYTHIYSAGGSTFISEPYYREYFAGGDGGSQGYAPSRSIYGDTAEGPSQSTYEGRYANHTKTAAVYTKTVTAAGLTVDLPSPDSGIGADAITPRDQNNIPQVNLIPKISFFPIHPYNTQNRLIETYTLTHTQTISDWWSVHEIKSPLNSHLPFHSIV